MVKSLWGLGDRRQVWLRDFAASVSFCGSESEFVERIIAYSIMEGVFRKVLVDPTKKVVGETEGFGHLMVNRTAQITNLKGGSSQKCSQRRRLTRPERNTTEPSCRRP